MENTRNDSAATLDKIISLMQEDADPPTPFCPSVDTGIFKASYSSDRKKIPTVYYFSTLSLDEIKTLRYGDHSLCLLTNGRIGEVKINGAVKTWKRDPGKIRVSVKYGLYQYGSFETHEALQRLCKRVPVPDPVENTPTEISK